ncbi:YbfB/YjiJ family MFS transporter [Helicobacter acinonychis]|uniref:YbfB/YjiJ family MFS transporter n=1 Tax=Helicobacter acinonychis TaxID=212 RepID=UPI0018F84D20|nr:YbfB/YjiJ family MFS transporter [Helicobacter acinonychis]
MKMHIFACFLATFVANAWAWVWRFLAGLVSASLVVLAAPLPLSLVKEKQRSSVSGFIFSGIGIGAIFSGFVLPFFAPFVHWAWILLGSLSVLAFLFAFTLSSPFICPTPPSKITLLNPPFSLSCC